MYVYCVRFNFIVYIYRNRNNATYNAINISIMYITQLYIIVQSVFHTFLQRFTLYIYTLKLYNKLHIVNVIAFVVYNL